MINKIRNAASELKNISSLTRKLLLALSALYVSMLALALACATISSAAQNEANGIYMAQTMLDWANRTVTLGTVMSLATDIILRK